MDAPLPQVLIRCANCKRPAPSDRAMVYELSPGPVSVCSYPCAFEIAHPKRKHHQFPTQLAVLAAALVLLGFGVWDHLALRQQQAKIMDLSKQVANVAQLSDERTKALGALLSVLANRK